MKHKMSFVLFALMLLTATVNAQQQESKLTLNLNYNYSFPLSGFKSDLASDASPRGFTGNIMYQVHPMLKVGLGVGYQDYYQKYPRQVYNYGKSQQVSAVLTNSLQVVPALARVEFFPFTDLGVQPYVSLAAGANFINYTQYLGQFGSTVANTGFRAQAGLGVKIPFSNTTGWGAQVGGSYDYAPYKKHGFRDLDNANVHAGVYFSIE